MQSTNLSPQTEHEAALAELAIPRLQPTPQDIAVLAQQFYESDGCPEGCAEVHWLAAERLLRRQSSSGSLSGEAGGSRDVAGAQ